MPAPETILQRLDWQVIRRLDGLLQGDYRSLFYGQGLDLADLREYQFGDDIRRIDWNVTARLATPYVRQYIEDRELTAWFLLDLSPSLDFGTASTFKRQMLIDAVAVMARILTRHGNRVGAILFGAQVDKVIPARGGRLQVLGLINDMLNHPRLPRAPLTDLATLMETGYRTVRRRSLVFIASDFIAQSGWERPLGLLAQRHEVVAIRLWDQREMELPDIGPVIMEDAETGEQMYVDTHDPAFRRRFQESARSREDSIRGAFRRANVDSLSLSTGDDLVRSFVRFAASRRQRRRQQALATVSA